MKPAIQPNTHNALTPRLVETHQTLDEVTMWQQTQPLVTWCTEDEVDLAEIQPDHSAHELPNPSDRQFQARVGSLNVVTFSTT